MDTHLAAQIGIGLSDKHMALSARKRMATLLLSGVALCWLASYILPLGLGWATFLRLTAEAGVVGGLADWFAVTALFKRPLGLPIPHTAIIPNSQPRIAEGLANYIEREFLQADMLSERLRKADVADMAERFLSDVDSRAKIVDAIVSKIPRLMSRERDMTVVPALAAALSEAVAEANLRPLVVSTISEAVKSPAVGRLVGEAAVLSQTLLLKLRPHAIKEIGRELGRLSPLALDRKLTNGVCDSLENYLIALTQEGSDERLRFDQWLKKLPFEIQNNPETLDRAVALAKGAFNDPQLSVLVGLIWNEARDAALADLASDTSKIRAGLDALLAQAARELDSNAMRRELNARLGRLLVTNVPVWRTEIVSFIKSSLGRYDPKVFAEKLELEVGNDLQIIRISGTGIGCLLGAAIFGLNHAAEWVTLYYSSH